MKNQIKFIHSINIASICILLFACADSGEKTHEQHKKEAKEEMEIQTESIETVDESSFLLPSPIQIAAIFNRAGLGFESGLTNPTSNLSSYNTKTTKYLNFGVYSADLAYVVLNKEQQESIDYLNAIKILADEIGMPSIFGSGQLIASFEKNIDNQDTILSILTTIKSRTDEYLAVNKDQSKEAIFFASAWIEAMYLGTNGSSNTNQITQRLIEQMTILENIITAVKVQKDTSLDTDFLLEGLIDLHHTFEGFKEIKNLDANNIDFDEIVLTSDELTTITEKITNLRTKIITS